MEKARQQFSDHLEQLRVASEGFRRLHRYGTLHPEQRDEAERLSSSGLAALKSLAVEVRSSQDYGSSSSDDRITVGGLLEPASNQAIHDLVGGSYVPPYQALIGYAGLGLREAMNKVAHADQARSGYYADAETHDLLLVGTRPRRGDSWAAVLSIPELCEILATQLS